MTHALTNVNVEGLYEIITSIDDDYADDAEKFVNFLRDNGYGISFEGLKAYAEYLDSEIDGKRLSANTYNKRLIGAKSRLRFLFKHSPESFDVLKRYQFEEALKELKVKKINSSAVGDDDILTPEEVEKLITESDDTTVRLMIEFLYATGVRITEMLNILLSDIKRSNGKYTINIRGKGNKERAVFAGKELVDRIKRHFKGTTYLFEHHGKSYNRISITNRIKAQGKIVLSKSISAHTLRHSFATHMLQKTNNLKGVSKYLGHSSTSTTADLYVHSELSWEDLVD